MNNPSIEAALGDILYGKNNKNINGVSPHFIIYLGPAPGSMELFTGAMLTSSSGYSNIALKDEHFEKLDKNGKK